MSFIEKVFKQEKDKLNIVNFQKSQKIVQFILTVLLRWLRANSDFTGLSKESVFL